MLRIGFAICLIALLALPAEAQDKDKDKKPADKKDDSPIVARTRKKLDMPLSVDFKDTRLKDVFDELEKQTELIFRADTKGGVSLNTNVSYTAKEKPLKEILDEIFKPRGLGYIIHRKQNPNDRYEGYLDIVQGNQRGDEGTPAKEPAKTDPKKPKPDSGKTDKPDSDEMNEKLAASKLKQAKLFAEEKQFDDAKEYYEQIIKKYPKTKAAIEAKELLEKLKKK